jgi:predicted acetylornithine/succinylornithine family transaminase
MEGTADMNTIALEQQHSAGTYPKRDLALVRGQGAVVWDEQGREYIDCVGGHGVALVGHCHPVVTQAISEQAAQMVTCPGIFYNDRRARLLARLAELTWMERAFLCNSGTESVEGAFKFARLSTGRSGIIATMRGFHGRTMGALSATWNKKYREPFMPLIPGFTHVPYGKIERMEKAVSDETAAVIIEVVQGEGGVRPGAGEYFDALRTLCNERSVLLIVDEVQTGFGRTGKLFAWQHYGVRPDILCLAKGIAGGVPMGAIMLGPRVTGLRSGVHGSTFGGNPLACAAALATIDVIVNEDLPAQAAEKGAYMLERIAQIDAPAVREIRGLGLMIGIELRMRARPYLEAMMAHGVLALPAGPTVIRLLPPLTISYSEMDAVLSALEYVLTHEPEPQETTDDG